MLENHNILRIQIWRGGKMITGYYCTNIFSERAKELIEFYRENLTIECLKKKGISVSEAIRYDWGTYKVRLNDIDGNEIVIVEFA